MRALKSQKHRVWRFFRADGSEEINPTNALYPFRAMGKLGDWFVVDKADCSPANVMAMAHAMGKAMGACFTCRTRSRAGRGYLVVTRVDPNGVEARKVAPRPIERGQALERIAALKPGESLRLSRGSYDPLEIARALRSMDGVSMTRHYGVATIRRAG